MTRARDVANVLSTATSLATDTETAAAISSHATASNGHISYGNTEGRPASPITGQVYSNTQTGFMEVYNGTSWEAIGAVASTVTGVTATNQGSGRAYNNGQSSVAFTPGSVTGSSYAVTSSPGSYTATGSASPLTVTGLQSATEYTYTVVASNRYGTASASAASTGVTATTVPQAPTIGTATGADQSATLTFTAGATGGSSITNYKYSTDNSTYTAFSPAQTSSPLTISGLTNGQSYAFYLKAVNANGDSAASAASNSVAPVMSGDFESISSTTLSTNSSSITFSSIPSTYKHLQIRGIARSSNSFYNGGVILRLNGDSGSNYSRHRFEGFGESALSQDGTASATSTQLTVSTGGASLSNNFSVFVLEILDYSNTNKNTTMRCLTGYDNNGNGSGNDRGVIQINSSVWDNTSAVNSIVFTLNDSSNFVSGSKFALYGIKGV
jgi:hypothetical protein